MPYREKLVELDGLVEKSKLFDSYACQWSGEIPHFTVYSDGDIVAHGLVHEVVDEVKKLIPPTIEEAMATIEELIKYLKYHNMCTGGTVRHDADKLIERYKATKPSDDIDLSIFD